MDNPWDQLPMPLKGDESSVQTFQAVGEALSNWEYFEGYLALLFAYLVASGDRSEPAALAYGTIVSFKGRADMIWAAMDGYFGRTPEPDLQERMSNLLKRAEKYCPRRNEIAHGIVQPYVVAGSEALAGFALVPAHYAAKKHVLEFQGHTRKMTPKYAYASWEIGYYGNHFNNLAKGATTILPDLFAHWHATQ